MTNTSARHLRLPGSLALSPEPGRLSRCHCRKVHVYRVFDGAVRQPGLPSPPGVSPRSDRIRRPSCPDPGLQIWKPPRVPSLTPEQVHLSRLPALATVAVSVSVSSAEDDRGRAGVGFPRVPPPAKCTPVPASTAKCMCLGQGSGTGEAFSVSGSGRERGPHIWGRLGASSPRAPCSAGCLGAAVHPGAAAPQGWGPRQPGFHLVVLGRAEPRGFVKMLLKL